MVSLNFRGFLPFRVSINNHVFLRDSLAKVKRPKQQDYESAPNKTTLRWCTSIVILAILSSNALVFRGQTVENL